MIYCLEDFSRREGRPAWCGPPFLARMAPNDSARQEWASEPPSSRAATGTTEVPVGTKANIEARRILEPFSRTLEHSPGSMSLRVGVTYHGGEPVRCHGKPARD